MVRTRHLALLYALPAAMCMAAPGRVYSNSLYRFSFTPPAGWSVEPHPGAVAVFLEPNDTRFASRHGSESNREFIERVNRKLKEGGASSASFRANLTISAERVTAGTTAGNYGKTLFSRAAGAFKCRLLGRKATKLGDAPAELVSARLDPADGGSIVVRNLIVIRGDTALCFALSSAPESSARHAAEFDRAMATLKWK